MGELVDIPGFAIERELGRGAMGVVYLAREKTLDRDVALKVLREGFRSDGEDTRRRFEREARAAARLRHPGIVPILSSGESAGRMWFAMEFVPGETLEDVLEKARHGRIARPRAARIVRDVALALHAAHEAGVTHRDVKPGNVMLLEESVPEGERLKASRRTRRSWLRRAEGGDGAFADRPLLADFGLATDRTASKLSESGMLIGTPGYMAPEQYRGLADHVGPHSDQWALGVLLYESITSNMPFPTGDLPTLARLIGNEDPIPPSRHDPRIDRDLETICLKCLEKNPKDRYADCRALASDLGAWLREEPIAARPPGAWRRLTTWTRRHPVKTTAVGALALASLIALGVMIGVRRGRAQRVEVLANQASGYMARAQYEQAEGVYDEWITVDPSDGRPRDLRTTARALRGIEDARATLQTAQIEMQAVSADRERLAALREQARVGKNATGGRGLGEANARGSEPWWMRQPAYEARRQAERLRIESIAERAAAVSETLALARSQAAAHAVDAGDAGAQLEQEILKASAAWHMAEWRIALAEGDRGRAARHAATVNRLDAATYGAELSGIRPVRIMPATPPGQAWLFRYEREGDVIARGGPRLIPVPYNPNLKRGEIDPAYTAAVAARLKEEGNRRVAPDLPALTDPLRSDERNIATLAGPMRRTRYAKLLADTVYPLAASDTNALGPLAEPLEVNLIPGRYLILLRREGRPDLRISFLVSRAETPPVRAGEDMDLAYVPSGWQLVPGGEVLLGAGQDSAPSALPRQRVPLRSFLAARFEVTYAEWWAFLNDPRTVAIIDALRFPPPPARGEPTSKPELRFVPRSSAGREGSRPDSALPDRPKRGQVWRAMANPEHPATHLSLYDVTGYLIPPEGEDEPHDYQYEELADALRESRTVGWGYLRWRTDRSRARAKQAAAGGELLPDVAVRRGADGKPVYCAMRFTLPTQPEWERMARGGDDRRFVYGDEREWLHFKGVASRPTNPSPEAVGLFPDDESMYGIRDLTGSVAEWTADWDGEGRIFWLKGSSWASQGEDDDRIAARRARAPHDISATVGIRLIVRELEPVAADK